MAEVLLRVERVHKHYPGVHAVNDVSAEFARGTVHALLGENGAGKSTLVKLIAGVATRDGGALFWDGAPIEIHNPRHASELGIRVIHQELSIIRELTVLQNVFLGIEPRRLGTLNERQMRRQFDELCEFMGYSIDPERTCRELSLADQKLLEVMKALARQARMLIMDEPTDSMGEVEKKLLFAVIRRLEEQGVSIVYITHFLEEVFEIAQRVIVLRDGKLVGTRSVAETTMPELIQMMIGDVDLLKGSQFHPGEADMSATPLLAARNVTRTGALQNVSFRVHAGEVVGITGLLGAGKSELLNAAFGAMRVDSMELSVGGTPVRLRTPRDGVLHGIALVPEDRKNHGLILKHDTVRNITITSLAPFLRALWKISTAGEETAVHRLAERLHIKIPDYLAPVRQLSGGNQQKVVLAKWLHADRQVLLLDEPTRGIDVGSKAEIYAIIHELAAEGKGVVVASAEPGEIAAHCDRIYVLHLGKVVAEYRHGVTEQELMHAMLTGQERQ
jgi:ribose transport system ATP-binding protein